MTDSTAIKTTRALAAANLRKSVHDFQDSATTETERQAIHDWWVENGVDNEFHAILAAVAFEEENHMFVARFVPFIATAFDLKPYSFITDSVEKAEAHLNNIYGEIAFRAGSTSEKVVIDGETYTNLIKDTTGTNRIGVRNRVGTFYIKPIDVI